MIAIYKSMISNLSLKLLLVVCILTVSFGAFSSTSDLESEIREIKAPLERSLQSIDRLHISKLSYNEYAMAVTSNRDLQKDIYARMISLRDVIYQYSIESRKKSEIENLKLFLTDYHSKLVRIVSIFFNYHNKFGGFPTMEQIRSLNAFVAKKNFVKIVDLVKMKARHINDKKIEILIKEIEYVQIASTTYLSNVDRKRDSYANLVQFMAVQQTIINRGQLSKMDKDGVLVEKPVMQCMPKNLYISEQHNFKISDHVLNEEDEMTIFFSEYSEKLRKVLPELAAGEYYKNEDGKLLIKGLRGAGYLSNLFNDEQAITAINGYAALINKKINELREIGDAVDIKELVSKEGINIELLGGSTDVTSFKLYKDDSPEGKKRRIEAYYNGFEEIIAGIFSQSFTAQFKNQDSIRKVHTSFLNGDKIDLDTLTSRARREFERDLYVMVADFVKRAEKRKSSDRINLKSASLPITKMMNRWETKLRGLLTAKIKKFNVNFKSREKNNDEFLEKELVKVYPYLKSIYFSRLVKKAGENLESEYKKHPYRKHLVFNPDMPSDLAAVTSQPKFLGLCPNEEMKILKNLQAEINDEYMELVPFIELLSANPNDHFESTDGFVTLNNKTLDRRVFANLGEFFDKRSYPADLKYSLFLQKQLAELRAYSETGDKNYLSSRMVRFMKARSQHNQGRYDKGTAKDLIIAMSQRQVKNSTKDNVAVKTILSNSRKLQAQKEKLMWNITLWKVGEYIKEFKLTDSILKIKTKTLKESFLDIKSHVMLPKNRMEADSLFQAKKSCGTGFVQGSKQDPKSLSNGISSYSSEQIQIISHYSKGKLAPASKAFSRSSDLFPKDGKFGKPVYFNYYQAARIKFFKKLMVEWGIEKGLLNATVAKSTSNHGFKLSAKNQGILAKNRLNELYSISLMMRTPYELGTSGDSKPTAFRLLTAYSPGDLNNELNVYKAKSILRETMNQAMRNSKKMAESWCEADYTYKPGFGSNANSQFKHMFRNVPLMREQILAEIELLEMRRPKQKKKWEKTLREIDKYVDNDSKTAGERLHETIEMISMILGMAMLLAMMVWGVGWFVGGWIFAGGKIFMGLTMSHLVFSIFIASFASRMHHIYFRTPAALDAQFRVATTQIIKPLYTNWDKLEKAMAENKHERTAKSAIAWHVAEGVFQGIFAVQIARAPYVRYSMKYMSSLIKKFGLPEITMAKPLKAVKFKNIFKFKNIRNNTTSIKNLISNGVNKLFKQKSYLVGLEEIHKVRTLEFALANRTKDIAMKHFDLNDMKKLVNIIKKDLAKVKKVKEIKVTNLLEIEEVFVSNGEQVLNGLGNAEKVKVWLKNLLKSTSRGLKRKQFRMRSRIKAWRHGDHKLLGNKGLKAWRDRRADLDDAFNEMIKLADDQKDLIKKSMIKKLEAAMDDGDDLLEIAAAVEGDVFKTLFTTGGPGSFTSAEVTQFITYSMTKMKFGSMKAKFDYLKMMIADFPVLAKRLAFDPKLAGKVSKEAYVLLKQADESAVRSRELLDAIDNAQTIDDLLLSEANVAKAIFDKEADALSTLVDIPRLKWRFKDWINAHADIISAYPVKKQEAIARYISYGLIVTVGVLLSQDEIDYRFEQFKDLWQEFTGRRWHGIEALLDENSFTEVIEQAKESDLLGEDELDQLIKKYNKAFKSQFKVIEKMEEERIENEKIDHVKDAIDHILSGEDSEEDDYMQLYEKYKSEADSLGYSDKIQEKLDLLKKKLEREDFN